MIQLRARQKTAAELFCYMVIQHASIRMPKVHSVPETNRSTKPWSI